MNNYEEENLNKLYQVLYNQCAILPPISNFQYFKISNLKRNNDINDINNSYRKKLGLKLLKIQRHEEFMQIYGKKNPEEKYRNLLITKMLSRVNPDMESLLGHSYYRGICVKKNIQKAIRICFFLI